MSIVLPNFEEVREEEGLKNIYLGNTLVRPKLNNIAFFATEDKESYIKYYDQVTFHKIVFKYYLGLGCGKIFK